MSWTAITLYLQYNSYMWTVKNHISSTKNIYNTNLIFFQSCLLFHISFFADLLFLCANVQALIFFLSFINFTIFTVIIQVTNTTTTENFQHCQLMMSHPYICFIDDTIFIKILQIPTDYLLYIFFTDKLSKRNWDLHFCGKFIVLQKKENLLCRTALNINRVDRIVIPFLSILMLIIRRASQWNEIPVINFYYDFLLKLFQFFFCFY